jgi:hypothetical protein
VLHPKLQFTALTARVAITAITIVIVNVLYFLGGAIDRKH